MARTTPASGASGTPKPRKSPLRVAALPGKGSLDLPLPIPRGKSFADVRDHALIRILSEGLRRTEVVQMRMDDLPADLVLQPVIRVVPLKGRGRRTPGDWCRWRTPRRARCRPTCVPTGTFANDWLSNGGAEGDLMRLAGWKTRSMVDRYGADMAQQRAIEAKRHMGDLY
jgi:integrase